MKKVVFVCSACGTVADPERLPGNLQEYPVPKNWFTVRVEVSNNTRSLVNSALDGDHACSVGCVAQSLKKIGETLANVCVDLPVAVTEN
jgi:hypothetical protein